MSQNGNCRRIDVEIERRESKNSRKISIKKATFLGAYLIFGTSGRRPSYKFLK